MLPTVANVVALLAALWLLLRLKSAASSRRRKLPPGPPAFPIIGNLHLIGSLPHRSLQNLATTYGPIMSMRFGQVPTIVVSSPEMAELFLRTHDNVFASRPEGQAGKYLSYGTKGIVLTKYGPYWRDVRKMSTLQLLTPAKVESFSGIRAAELGAVVLSIREAAATHGVVNLSKRVVELVENITCRTVLGRCKDERFELKRIIGEVLTLIGSFNIGDYVPYLKPFDVQGLTKRMKATSKDVDKMLNFLIDEHMEAGRWQDENYNGDFIDTLLSWVHKSKDSSHDYGYEIDRNNIKAILLEMIGGAVDTSSSTSEWAMSELIRHPKVIKKLQHELKSVIGVNRMVEESDLPNLPYLDMVVRETMRLHPVGPLLAPHEAMEDITINGYFIHKNSRVLVNAFAIGRDRGSWSENAEEFLPERFEGSSVDVKGRHFQLLPFGSGRRGCPGIMMGLVLVKLVTAQLVHCFDWELPSGVKPTEMDMSEKFGGLAMPKATPLLAMPTYRLSC